MRIYIFSLLVPLFVNATVVSASEIPTEWKPKIQANLENRKKSGLCSVALTGLINQDAEEVLPFGKLANGADVAPNSIG